VTGPHESLGEQPALETHRPITVTGSRDRESHLKATIAEIEQVSKPPIFIVFRGIG
jgi:hypothetical protein